MCIDLWSACTSKTEKVHKSDGYHDAVLDLSNDSVLFYFSKRNGLTMFG
jgi:hypothetical protein